MFKLDYCEEKNRIYINIKDDFSKAETDAYINSMMALIEKARLGFTVLADVSEGRISFLEKSAEFQIIRDNGIKKGLKNVATVLAADAYELHKTKPFSGIKNTFLSVEKAEAFLDSL